MGFFSLSMSALIGAFTTYICIYLLKPVAIRIGLVDMPGGRKQHTHVIPLIGGIAIFLGFCFSLLCLNISLHAYRGLLAGSGILVLLGVMDDFHELTPRTRLIGQCLACLLLMQWGHLSITHLGNLFSFGNINLGMWSFAITIFFVLGFINAINMIDGHDGLAGLIVLGQAVLLAYINLHLQLTMNFYVLMIFISALCVFLVFNFSFLPHKHATIFMGDAGSTFIGFVIAYFAVCMSQSLFTQSSNLHFNLMTLLWVLAYPLYDLVAVIFHRVRAKKSPLMGGRDHLHHLLLDLGLKRSMITYVLFAFSSSLGVLGVMLVQLKIPEAWQLLCFFGVFLLYFFSILLLQTRRVSVT